MNTAADDVETLYPYTRDDLERVNPSQIRAGDLMAHRGPVGSGRWVGDRVLSAGWAGHSKAWGGDKYLITYRQTLWGHELEIGQPESIPVYRVLRDRIKERAA